MRTHTLLFLLSFLFISSSLLYGQKQIWDIYTVDDQPYARVVLDKVQSDTLFVKSTGNEYKIEINAIKTLTRKRKSKAVIGTLAGMAIGGVALNLYAKKKAENQNKFPVDLSDLSTSISTGLGIFGGGIVGYLVGTGFGADEKYNFSKLTADKRKSLLKHLLERDQ